MEKAANDHIGPKLDKLVKENQEKIYSKREECEKKLVARTADYKAELQNEFETSLKHIREVCAVYSKIIIIFSILIIFAILLQRYNEDESSSYVTRNRKIEEVKARHDNEIRALKARFSQDKVLKCFQQYVNNFSSDIKCIDGMFRCYRKCWRSQATAPADWTRTVTCKVWKN